MPATIVMSHPCSNCPFLKVGGIRLHPRKSEEIARNAINIDGTRFPCHKSFAAKGGYDQDEDLDREDGLRDVPSGTADCAGSFLMGWKNGEVMTSYHQITSRMGWWNPEAIQGAELVFDTVEEMVACNVADPMNARFSAMEAKCNIK